MNQNNFTLSLPPEGYSPIFIGELHRSLQVHGDMRHEPIVGNFVETAPDVALQNPLRVCVIQCVEALLNRIRAGPLLAEPI